MCGQVCVCECVCMHVCVCECVCSVYVSVWNVFLQRKHTKKDL